MFGRQNPYQELERSIGYRFRNRGLLQRALTHRSYRFEDDACEEDNQRLEFLGDAVLGMLAAAYLFHAAGDKAEGALTSLRSQVASGKALAAIARDLGLGDYLLMGKGEVASGGRTRNSNLEDALEAVIGAAWLDGESKGAGKVFDHVFVPRIEALDGDVWRGNPKGKLQEFSQSRWKCSPSYEVLSREGPPHAAVFTVGVTLPDGMLGMASASSKQSAEAMAAADVLAQLAARTTPSL
jgi:ribonuclease-3